MAATKPEMPSASSTNSASKCTTVGKRLRKGRLDMQWSLDQVGETLKIRKEYLKAIEADDYKSLPEQIYATGFVRAYAKLVSLDPSQVTQEFSQAYQAVIQPSQEEPPLQVIVPTHKPQNRILFISLFILTILVVIWLGTSHQQTQDLFQELSHRVKQFIVPTKPIHSSPDTYVEVPSALEEPFLTMPPEDNDAVTPQYTSSHVNSPSVNDTVRDATVLNPPPTPLQPFHTDTIPGTSPPSDASISLEPTIPSTPAVFDYS